MTKTDQAFFMMQNRASKQRILRFKKGLVPANYATMKPLVVSLTYGFLAAMWFVVYFAMWGYMIYKALRYFGLL